MFDISRVSRIKPAVTVAAALTLTLGSDVAFGQLGLGGSQIFQQGAGGVPGAAALGEEFGRVLAVGDFDDDGFDDLVIATPTEDIAPTTTAGSITVISGSPSGPDGSTSETIDLNGPAGQSAGSDDLFGSALAVGDFDFDGYDDLAVGIPGYRVTLGGGGGSFEGAGAVLVLYGSASGLGDAGAQIWHQGGNGIIGAPEAGDNFGMSLAAGDINGDFFDDLAIGVPNEDVGAIQDAGAVNVVYGSPGGLTTSIVAPDNQILVQEDFGLSASEAFDRFGWTLALADFTGDGRDDLAVGVPYEDWGGEINAGVVFMLVGSLDGVALLGSLPFSQDLTGIEGDAGPNHRFGFSLAPGDFDGDGLADLAVGTPGQSSAAGIGVGVVDVLRGVAGLGLSQTPLAHFEAADLGHTPAASDALGHALAAFDVGGDARDELVIGAPGVTVSGAAGAGVAFVVFGVDEAAPTSVQAFSQDGAVPGALEAGDAFGASLSVGDFDGNGFADLAVGVPDEDVGAIADGGAVNVLLSMHIFRDGFESGGTGRWVEGP
jgi:hypothetical protein